MNLPDYIGHLHPVLVHLPIGILLLAILFDWISHRKGFRKLRKSVRLMLFLGFISAAFSSFTGYLLSKSGDYDEALLDRHQWLGISVSVLSFVILVLRRGKQKEMRLAYSVMLFVLAVLIMLTGHAGGSLTHGTDFLEPPPVANWFGGEVTPEIQSTDLSSAFLYRDLVAPVLKQKCSRCHGASRQKGKLRLDQPEFILKGGEDGAIVNVRPWEESDLYRRIHLEEEDDDHMPPKDKAQLSKREISILSYWIMNGADFQSKLAALPKSDSLIVLLSEAGQESLPEEKVESVAMPDAKTIEMLKSGGVVTSFIRQDNGSILVSFLNADTTRIEELLGILPAVTAQLSDLKLTGCHLSGAGWAQLEKLTSLRRLYLDHSNATDQSLASIKMLPQLQYVNLVATPVTATGVSQLKSLPNLKSLYLFNTAITATEEETVRALFPKAHVDFGRYQVPTLPSDTTVLTKPYIIQ